MAKIRHEREKYVNHISINSVEFFNFDFPKFLEVGWHFDQFRQQMSQLTQNYPSFHSQYRIAIITMIDRSSL